MLLDTDFTGANLRGVDFTKVKYVSATRGDQRLTLRRVTFTNANLRDTKFAWMKLVDVTFTGADLRKAKMKGVVVSRGSGVRANLRSADLSYATLKTPTTHRLTSPARTCAMRDSSTSISRARRCTKRNLVERSSGRPVSN